MSRRTTMIKAWALYLCRGSCSRSLFVSHNQEAQFLQFLLMIVELLRFQDISAKEAKKLKNKYFR